MAANAFVGDQSSALRGQALRTCEMLENAMTTHNVGVA